MDMFYGNDIVMQLRMANSKTVDKLIRMKAIWLSKSVLTLVGVISVQLRCRLFAS